MDNKLPPSPRAQVIAAMTSKSCMKQDVFEATKGLFLMMKEVLAEITEDLRQAVEPADKRLLVGYADKGNTACELRLAGDVIVFNMHTNVFKLDQSHSLWKTSYLQDDELRGYFGVVNMYNFLNDSFQYNRERDLGYLVARLFLNKDGHFFLQGKRQLGFLYNDLAGNSMDRQVLRELLFTVANYVIEFDLLAPPYDQVVQVSVSEINELNAHAQITTGKRLGFRFQAGPEDIT